MHLKKAYFRFDAGQDIVMGLGNGQTVCIGGKVLTDAAMIRVFGVLTMVDPFSARMSVVSGGVMIWPIVQNMQYPIKIITHGINTMTQETKQLADNIITAFKMTRLSNLRLRVGLLAAAK